MTQEVRLLWPRTRRPDALSNGFDGLHGGVAKPS
jgi:hypothetical protein